MDTLSRKHVIFRSKNDLLVLKQKYHKAQMYCFSGQDDNFIDTV